MHRILILSLILLSGCAEPTQTREQMVTTCRGYGFQPGSEGMASCTERQVRDQQQRQRQRLQAVMQAFPQQSPSMSCSTVYGRTVCQ